MIGKNPLPFGRGGMGHAPLLNGLFFLIGGEETKRTFSEKKSRTFKQVHTFDPRTGTFGQAPPLPTPIHGAYPISDPSKNRIYVIGGGTTMGESASSEFQSLYFPQSNKKVVSTMVKLSCAVMRTPMSSASLVCPGNLKIAEIQFAKLGRLEGRCGAYSSSDSCTIDISQMIVKNCLGLSSCKLEQLPKFSVCAGANQLAVQARCASFHEQNEPQAIVNDFIHIGDGCCRTALNSPGKYQKLKAKAKSICKKKCLSNPSCVGYEYVRRQCEIHFKQVTRIEANLHQCRTAVCYARAETKQMSAYPTEEPVRQCGQHDGAILENHLLKS